MTRISTISLTIAFFFAGCTAPAGRFSGDEQTVRPSQSAVDHSSLLKTKKVSLDWFFLTIPESLQRIHSNTLQPPDWVFGDEEMTVAFESGMYAPPLVNYGYLDFQEVGKTIDGEYCKIASFEDRNTSNFIEPEKRFTVWARFEQSDRVEHPLNIYVSFRSGASRPVAMAIVESIEFGKDSKTSYVP